MTKPADPAPEAPPSESESRNPLRHRSAFDWSTGLVVVAAVGAMLVVLLRDGKARFFEILHDDIWLFGGILPRILAGALIGSLLTLLLPRDKVSRAIGADSGLLGLFVATLFGALLPGGPFTIYPIASALLMMGADVGATIAFVTSWTLIGYARPIVWEMPIMGVEFTLWRILYCLPLPILAGLLGRYVVRLRPSWGRM